MDRTIPLPKILLLPLRGLGQIMLQENAATGLLFLIGIAWASPVMALAAWLAVCCGTATAILLKYDRAEIEQGLYGFSAALVGVALVLFRGIGPLVWLAIVAGSVGAAIVQRFFIARKIPVFTLPFVLVTWVLLCVLPVPTGLADAAPMAAGPVHFGTAAVARGFGQVIFQDNLFSGILFMVAVAMHSRIAVVFGVFGALLGALLAMWIGAPADNVMLGLYGYNAVLCAIAFAGTKARNYLLFLLSVPLAVLIGHAMMELPFPQLTFPFVVASCFGLLLEKVTRD